MVRGKGGTFMGGARPEVEAGSLASDGEEEKKMR